MKKAVDYLAYTMLLLTSSAIIPLLEEGGARDQFDHIESQGFFSTLPLIWKILSLLLFMFTFIVYKFKYLKIDFLFFLICLFFFSASLWAIFPRPSFFCAFNILFSYLIINLQVNLLGVKHTLYFLNNFFLIILTLSILTILIVPSYGISVGEHTGRWQGVFDHKNVLGSFASISFIFYLWLSISNKSGLVAYGILSSLILTIGSGSSTSLAILVIIILFFLLLRIHYLRNIIFSLRYLILSLLFIFSAACVLIALNGIELSILDKDTSFTGRNIIWTYFVDEIESSPLIGHGMVQFAAMMAEDDTDFIRRVGIPVLTAHNGFLDCVYSIGYIGLILITIRLFQLLDFNQYKPIFELALFYLIYLIILNTFEARLVGFTFQFIILMYIYALKKYRNLNKQDITLIH